MVSHTGVDFQHLVINVEKRTITVTQRGEILPFDLGRGVNSNALSKAKLLAPNFLKLMPHESHAKVLLEVILDKLSAVIKPDLTVDVRIMSKTRDMSTARSDKKGKRGKRKMTIKVLDYVWAACQDDPAFQPSLPMLQFHKYLIFQKRCALPEFVFKCAAFKNYVRN